MIKYIFLEFKLKGISSVFINSTDGFSLCFITYNCLNPTKYVYKNNSLYIFHQYFSLLFFSLKRFYKLPLKPNLFCIIYIVNTYVL